LTTPPRLPSSRHRESGVPFASDDEHLRGLAIAAARETLEEAAILHVEGGVVTQDEVFALRKELESEAGALRAFLAKRGLCLDLGALHPLAQLITPIAESRRYDTRFFVAVAPGAQTGAHDEKETMSSFWQSPSEILRRFETGDVALMPPTHRTLAMLADCHDAAEVIAMAGSSCLDPICPQLVTQADASGETIALVLPGDPEHETRVVRVPGPSRYVLRGDRWQSEDPPR